MPIPTLVDYRLPAQLDLPVNVASWRPDPQRCALLIHDMQQYFVDFFPAGSPLVAQLIENLRLILVEARGSGIPVFYTAQPGAMTQEERGLLRDIWGPGMTADPTAKRIVSELAPAPGDHVLTKWRYSAFHRTDLAEQLTRLGRDQLIVGGVYGHVGVLATLIEAFSRDIETFLVVDAFADFTEADHHMTVQYCSQRCAVTLTRQRLLQDLRSLARGQVNLGKVSQLHS
jgi:bifunctional isochorismate lyase/aryl carrier protein